MKMFRMRVNVFLALFCVVEFVAGHDGLPDEIDLKVANGIVKSLPTTDILDLICSCHEKSNTNESKIVSVDLTPNPADCFEIKELGYASSGRYNIYPSNIGIANTPVEVWCDMDTAEGGWSVIQRREDGSVNFNSTFEDYQRGFGYAGGEFWIGNENLHRITNQKSYKLRVDVDLWNGTEIIKEFIHFRIGDIVSKYQLILESGISQDYSQYARPLGMEDGRIPDKNITASSSIDIKHAATNARLNRPAGGGTWGAWVPKTQDTNQWIQVRFGSPHVIGGVISQGRQDWTDQWVTEFKVQYSDEGSSWTYVKNSNGQIAVFTGNKDKNTPVTNLFDVPVEAYFIRILPTKWHAEYISLRFEVLGFEGTELTDLNNQPFFTGDQDSSNHCAAVGGAWWYSNKCAQTGLNGEYLKGAGLDTGITWEDMGITYQVKRTEMKIRPAV